MLRSPVWFQKEKGTGIVDQVLAIVNSLHGFGSRRESLFWLLSFHMGVDGVSHQISCAKRESQFTHSAFGIKEPLLYVGL